MSVDGNQPEELGWRLDVDAEAGELRMEHGASGNVYVFDADGTLRVPGDGGDDRGGAGDGDVGGELRELRAALSSALDDRDARTASDLQSSCRVECNRRGEVVIESDTKISLDAPVIDLAADGQLRATASGLLTLQGSLIQLN